MQIQFDVQNRLQVTAENLKEANILMGVAYGENQIMKNAPIVSKEGKNTGTKKNGDGRKRARYSRTCHVEGCNKKVKNLHIHDLMSHGITEKGEIVDSFKHASGNVVSVKFPAVKIDNEGNYRLANLTEDNQQAVKSGLLGNTFKIGSVIK